MNADETEYLGVTETALSCNVFAYCENDVINKLDNSGNFPVHIIAGVVIGVAWAVIPRIITDVIRGRMSKISDYICDALIGAISGLVTSLTGSSTLGTVLGTVVGETVRFLLDVEPKLKISNFKEIVVGLLNIAGKALLAGISSAIAGRLVKFITKKSFSTKQIKNYFRQTKKLKSAFGIGKNGKTARRMWFLDVGFTTILCKLFGL